MNIENQKLFNKIIKLIELYKYSEADAELLTIINCKNQFLDKEYYNACFLRGYINSIPNYKNKSESIAQGMLLENINSSYPNPLSYSIYADIIKDQNISVSYLKNGLKRFPTSSAIYKSLIKHSRKEEQEKYVNEVLEKKIEDIELLCKIVEILIYSNRWIKAKLFLEILIKKNNISNLSLLYYKTLYLFSKCTAEQDIDKTKDEFLKIINEDTQNYLNYAPYIGYIWCCVKTKDITKAELFINKIPDTNVLGDFNDGPFWEIEVNLNFIYSQMFPEILCHIENKELNLKLLAIEALYLYAPSKIFNFYRYKKKHLANLVQYYKNHEQNIDISCAIYNMQTHFKKYFDAYKTYINMLRRSINPNKFEIYGLDFLDSCSQKDLNKIYEDIEKILKCQIEVNMQLFITDVFDEMIEYLWSHKDNYEKIVNLSNTIEEYDLKNSNKIFEIAFSYSKLDSKSYKAEKLYLYALKNDKQNSAILNNLGRIYEKRGHLEKSYDYFSKAYEIDNSDEICMNNFQRVSSEIKKYESGVNLLKKENIWLRNRLFKLYDLTNDTGKFTCTYKERALVLNVSPQKGEELFEKFIKQKYIFRLPSDGASIYKINPLIKNFFNDDKANMEKNRQFEIMGGKLNIDNLRDIGYTEEVIKLIDIIKDENLKSILKRDILECAVSVAIGLYKSAVVMCGSILETILIYIISRKGFKDYNIGKLFNNTEKIKKIKNMDLIELIEIGKKENILTSEEYHISQFTRIYRNIIHPSCEGKKQYYIVNSQTADLTWKALLIIIQQILNKEL